VAGGIIGGISFVTAGKAGVRLNARCSPATGCETPACRTQAQPAARSCTARHVDSGIIAAEMADAEHLETACAGERGRAEPRRSAGSMLPSAVSIHGPIGD